MFALTFWSEVNEIRRVIREQRIDAIQLTSLVAVQAAVAARLEATLLVWQLVDQGGGWLSRKLAIKVVRRLADVVMVTGQRVALRYFGRSVKASAPFVFYPPVDTVRFVPSLSIRDETRRELGIPRDALVVGTVANLSPPKGVEDFVEAARRIQREVDVCWFLMVGAWSDDGQAERIVSAINRSGTLADRFVFTGNREDVERYYPAMNVSLVTSVREGAPTTVLEAMSCGIPVVATDVGAIREMLVDGVTGVIVPPRKPTAIVRASVSILRDEPARRLMGDQARRHAVDQFGIDDCVQKHLGAYQAAMSCRRRF